MAKQANCKPENFEYRNAIKRVDKDEEIAFIVNMVLPKKLRTNLLSNTVSSNMRRK